jgi:GNAT superfamily N-acetyltransferase
MNERDQDPPSEFFVSTDFSLLDVPWVVREIRKTYFGSWRSESIVLRSLAPPSICYGLYESATKKQVGFARVVSDHATVSWVCDVVIEKDMRHHGLGAYLMGYVCSHEPVRSTAARLSTRNALTFYEKHGFEPCKDMRRLPK